MADKEQAYRPPKIADFSKEAVQKAVLKEGLTHPLTLFPPALGILSGLAGVLFSYPLLLGVAIGAGLVGVGNGIINIFLRNDALAGRYLKTLNARQEEHESWILESLKTDLEKCRSIKGAEEYALRGVQQFEKCRIKYQNVEDLLSGKLNVAEVTYGRFISAARQVHLSVLDNLRRIAAILRSAGTIDHEYIRERLKALKGKKNPTEADQKESAALKERWMLLKKQYEQAGQLLAANEEAMTRLEETTSQIALMETEGRFASTDFETAITYLQELAQSAHLYHSSETRQGIETL